MKSDLAKDNRIDADAITGIYLFYLGAILQVVIL
jgi:hypothetical protein